MCSKELINNTKKVYSKSIQLYGLHRENILIHFVNHSIKGLKYFSFQLTILEHHFLSALS